MSIPNPKPRYALRLATLCAVVAMLAPANAMPPPAAPFGNYVSWSPRAPAAPVTHLMMGAFRVALEKTTLAEVIHAAGKGSIGQRGDAGNSLYWVCYTAPSQRVWIIANGEMGGEEHGVGEIVARQVPGAKPSADCPALRPGLLPLRLDHALWLDTPETALHHLGTPSHAKGPWRAYTYSGKIPSDCPPSGYELMNWLLLKIRKGKVVELRAGQVTSC